jgi:hypothetical protein
MDGKMKTKVALISLLDIDLGLSTFFEVGEKITDLFGER